MKKKLLVSKCLLGFPCRYDGKSKGNAAVCALREKYDLVPACPEVLGGLPTPRTPSERQGSRVMMQDGTDVTENYRRGAEAAWDICQREGCCAALLKKRSPSCGAGEIYDGSFSHRLVPGDGVTAELFRKKGVALYDEEHLPK